MKKLRPASGGNPAVKILYPSADIEVDAGYGTIVAGDYMRWLSKNLRWTARCWRSPWQRACFRRAESDGRSR